MLSDKEFNDLQDYLEDKLTFNEENIGLKTMELASIHHKLIRLLSSMTKDKTAIEGKLDEMYGTLYKFYKFESEYRWETKGEIESQIFSDKRYSTIKERANLITVQITFVGKSLDSLKEISYQIKNYIDFQKLMNGI
jgi:hypothetical protein